MKTLILSSLVLCGCLAVSQNQPSTSTQTSNQAGNTDKRTKVTGCLGGSAGSYTLTEKSGQTFQLDGDTTKLSDHVGHTVEITGTPLAAGENPNADKSQPSSSGATSSQPTLSVSSMKHISNKCEKAR